MVLPPRLLGSGCKLGVMPWLRGGAEVAGMGGGPSQFSQTVETCVEPLLVDRKGCPLPPSAMAPGTTAHPADTGGVRVPGPGLSPLVHNSPSLGTSAPSVPPQLVLGPVLPLARCLQADRDGGLGLGGRRGGGAQLLQQPPREGAAPGWAGGLQARPHATLCPGGPRHPWPGQPQHTSGEGGPRAESWGSAPSSSFCFSPP